MDTSAQRKWLGRVTIWVSVFSLAAGVAAVRLAALPSRVAMPAWVIGISGSSWILVGGVLGGMVVGSVCTWLLMHKQRRPSGPRRRDDARHSERDQVQPEQRTAGATNAAEFCSARAYDGSVFSSAPSQVLDVRDEGSNGPQDRALKPLLLANIGTANELDASALVEPLSSSTRVHLHMQESPTGAPVPAAAQVPLDEVVETATDDAARLPTADDDPRMVMLEANQDTAAQDAPVQPQVSALGVWQSDDRALACATVIADVLTTTVPDVQLVALDVAGRRVQAYVQLGPAVDTTVFDRIADAMVVRQPTWQIGIDQGIVITMPDIGGLPSLQWQPVLPLIAVDRKQRTLRYVPWASWPAFGVYGAAATTTVHTILTTVLCHQAPTEMGLLLLDKHSALGDVYNTVPHRVDAPAAQPERVVALLTQAVQSGARGARPLCLVVVDPQPPALNAIKQLLRWLYHQPGFPLRLIVMQTNTQPTGVDIYARMPAVITGHTSTQPTWLPGVGRWPKPDTAVIVQRHGRWHGTPVTTDDVDAAAIVRDIVESFAPDTVLPPVVALELGQGPRAEASSGQARVYANHA